MSDAALALSRDGSLRHFSNHPVIYRRWTPEELQTIRVWYQAGHTAPAIAAHFGVSETAIKSILRRLGAFRRSANAGGDIPLSKTQQVAEHLAEGLGLSDIADRMGITRGAAKQAFKRIKRALGEQAQ